MRGELGARVDAGVRGENVDAAVLARRRGRRAPRRRRRSVTSAATPSAARPAVRSAVAVGRQPRVDVGEHDMRALGREHGGDPESDSARAAGDDGDLIGELLAPAPPLVANYTRAAADAALLRAATRSTATARRTRRSGRSSRASASRSSASRASATTSRRRRTSRPSRTPRPRRSSGRSTGPITVAGAEAGGAVAVTIHAVEVMTPGVVVYGGYTATTTRYEWWDDETALRRLSGEGGVAALRRANDAADATADRLPRGRALPTASRTRSCRAATAATSTAARSARARRWSCPSSTTAPGSTSATARR